MTLKKVQRLCFCYFHPSLAKMISPNKLVFEDKTVGTKSGGNKKGKTRIQGK